MKYIAYYIELDPVMPAREYLYGICQIHPVETLEETDTGIVAFLPDEEEQEGFVQALNDFEFPGAKLTYTIKEFEPTNWNLLWEENFEPIAVGDDLRIRATFHEPDPSFKEELIIDPKMSFGTGHHQTTWLMLTLMKKEAWKDVKVLDMGCGTGILGVYAAKHGAKVEGIDVEAWAAENARENAEKNGVEMKVYLGGEEKIQGEFEVILANINRNVLLEQIPVYSRHLKSGGLLFLSGFYSMDLDMLKAKAEGVGFEFNAMETKEDWVAARFTLKKS